MLTDHSKMKLGRPRVRHDARNLVLAKYLTSALPKPPDQVDYVSKVASWTMSMNDQIGDCAYASFAHMLQSWSRYSGECDGTDFEKTGIMLADEDVLKAYMAWSGYNPDDPSTDNGAVELDVLKNLKSIGIAGKTIAGFATFSPHNDIITKDSTFLFGGSYIGLALPLTAQTQDTWDVPMGGPRGPGKPNSWGGHAVPILAYDDRTLTVVTWGQPKQMTWAFYRTYADEAYALLSTDFVTGDTVPAPSGFDRATLQQDLAAL